MIGLLQRVTSAAVVIDGETAASIGSGLLVLVGVQKEDDEARAERLLERLLTYRVFNDEEGRMNLSLRDTGGELLLVPQFTLTAETRKGTRAGFSSAAEPEAAGKLFEYLVGHAETAWPGTQAGQFGADMKVSLTNDGPVTFWLES